MPALVNYSGEYELYSRQSMCSSDLGLLNDIYCSPRKRPRIDMPYVNNRVMYNINKKPSIEVLPDECLFEIFKRLPGPRERSVSAFVSKRWLALLSSMRASDINMTLLDDNQEEVCGSYIERSLEGKKATDTRLYGISIGTSRHGGLRKLSIRGSNVLRGVTNSGLSAIGHGCPFLKELFLWNISTIDDEGLLEIARGCRLLERFDLCQCPNVTDKGLAALAEKCPNLSTLSIESCFSICNKGLKAIGKHCPKLQSISIKNCPLVGDEGIAGILSTNSTILKTIKFQGLNVSDISLALIGHYGLVVTDLVLSGLQKVSQRGFWTMAKANGLHLLASLTLTSCHGVTDMSIEAMAKGCPNLKHVCLRKCCFVSDNGLVAFTKSVQLLESLQLEECNRISQTGVLGALTHCSSKFKSFSIVKCLGLIKNVCLEEDQTLFPCQSLRSLSIRYCPGFTTGTLAMVMKLCPQLRRLDLSGLHMITDEAIMPFIETCEAGLIKVNLKDCKNLTDESISVLARLHGKTLQFLNLDGCRNVTDASLNAIAYYCIVINELDVSKCSITDSGVAALCDEVHSNLQTLSISGCSMVSDKSCGYLKMLSETLSALNIRNCKSLSRSGVEQLIEELWRCDIFS